VFDEGGLDGDLPETGDGETTGRMIAVSLNKPSAASQKAMLKEISNVCGLGARASDVCTSSDFGDAGIEEAQADSAEVVVLEDLGIALLNGDVDQNSAAGIAASEDGSGVIMEPEYINYALGFDELDVMDDYGLEDSGSVETIHDQGLDRETLKTVLKLLTRILDTDGRESSLSNESDTISEASQCFSDSSRSTWGLKATRTTNSRASGAGIKVAVLDTGMDLGHPDFSNRKIQHAVFQTNGSDNRIHDVNGHGTHCIGTACGPERSRFGPRYGVAFESEIFAGKVLAHNSATGRASGGDFAILRGIQWAISNGCEVISMSLGARVTRPGFPQSYEQAARIALQNGSLIIAATGNDSRRPGSVAPVGRPANCPSILGVAAVDRCLRIASFSNGRRFAQSGAEVNISGPGVRVLSSIPRQLGNIGLKSGTSMATPHVAGIAALLAQQTGLRGVPLYRELRRRARRLGNFNDFGNGLVQS